MSICTLITKGTADRETVAQSGPCLDAFRTAISRGDVSTVKAMLQQGSNVNHVYDLGLTPLHFAALHSHKEVVKVLLDAGANPNAVTNDGCYMTARAIAEAEGHTEVVEVIMKACKDRPAVVTLHIYDLGSSSGTRLVNRVFRAMGTGAFHAAVEVYGRELSFGYTTPEVPTGVFTCPPRNCPLHTYRECVDMGTTRLSEKEVQAVLAELSRDWLGPSYDMLRRNCCHFADAFCARLGVGPIPRWVTSLSGAATEAATRVGEVDHKLKISETISMSAKYNLGKLRELDETISEAVKLAHIGWQCRWITTAASCNTLATARPKR